MKRKLRNFDSWLFYYTCRQNTTTRILAEIKGALSLGQFEEIRIEYYAHTAYQLESNCKCPILLLSDAKTGLGERFSYGGSYGISSNSEQTIDKVEQETASNFRTGQGVEVACTVAHIGHGCNSACATQSISVPNMQGEGRSEVDYQYNIPHLIPPSSADSNGYSISPSLDTLLQAHFSNRDCSPVSTTPSPRLQQRRPDDGQTSSSTRNTPELESDVTDVDEKDVSVKVATSEDLTSSLVVHREKKNRPHRLRRYATTADILDNSGHHNKRLKQMKKSSSRYFIGESSDIQALF